MSNKSVDVNIQNGSIHMQTTTVTGNDESIAKIQQAVERGDVFDVSGTNIKVGFFEKASTFIRKFGL
jgi:hypothetical protein